MSDIAGGNDLQHVLVRRSDVDLRKLRREHAREEDVVAFENFEVAVFDGEPREQYVAQDGRVAVCGETDNLAFVTARLHAESRGHRFVERPERVGKLDAVQPFNLSSAADADAACQAGTVAIESDDQRVGEAARVVGVGRMTEVVFYPLEFSAKSQFQQRRFELFVPLLVKYRRGASPLFGPAFGDVARDDTVAGEQ